MRHQQVQVIFLLLTFGLALFEIIGAARYATWSSPMVAGHEDYWLSLVFYIGTVPLLSLLFASSYIVGLHFNVVPMNPSSDDEDYESMASFLLGVSALHSLGWLIQACLCTACELVPILTGAQGRVSKWCPQSHFKDTNTVGLANMMGELATAKDVLQWIIFIISIGLIECARRTWMQARVQSATRLQIEAGKKDEGIRTIDMTPMRPYMRGPNPTFPPFPPPTPPPKIPAARSSFRASFKAALRSATPASSRRIANGYESRV